MRRNQKRGLSYFQWGMLTIIIVAAGTYLGFTKRIPFVHHYTLSAVFPNANNLRTNSPVRIAGVNVGKVTNISRVDSNANAARVTMELQSNALPIHKDATLDIRPRIFLEGNFFVDVHPGSPSAPTVHDGDTIPINQTHAPVQLDQILTALQEPTRADLQKLLRELSTGLAGQGGAGYNRSIAYWKAAYKNSAIVNDATLGLVKHDLSNYIKGAATTAAALDQYPQELQSLITDFNTTAAAFAARQQALGQAIVELPRTLHAALPALAALNTAFPPLRRLVADLRPGTRSALPALKAGVPFVRQLNRLVQPAELRGLVHDLVPTVPALARLNSATVPLLKQNRLGASCTNEVLLPWSHDTVPDKTFPAIGPVYKEATDPLVGLASESRTGDANGQWFRVLIGGGNYTYPQGAGQFLMSNEPIMGTNPPVPAERSPLRSDVACETQQPPDLRTVPGDPPSGERHVAAEPASGPLHDLVEESRTKLVEWADKMIKVDHLSDTVKVLSTPAGASTIAADRAARSRAVAQARVERGTR